MKTIPLLLVLLAGCASQHAGNESDWTREGATVAQIRRDLAACRLEGERYRNPHVSGLIPAAIEGGRQTRMVSDCMIAKGYEPQPKNRTNSRPKATR